jgi:hypothetical protein
MKIKFAKITVFAGLAWCFSALWAGGEEFGFQNVPLDIAIKTLARQTGHNFVMSPNFVSGLDAAGKSISRPAITFHGESSPADLLAKLLKDNGLVMVDDPVTTVARIAYTNELTRKADAALLAGDTNAPIQVVNFVDVPLDVALEEIASRSGALTVVVDPQLAAPPVTADHQLVVPPTVSVRWEKITARQALLALAVNYDLAVTPDKQTGAWRVKKR